MARRQPSVVGAGATGPRQRHRKLIKCVAGRRQIRVTVRSGRQPFRGELCAATIAVYPALTTRQAVAATKSLDWMHAVEHLEKVAKLVYGSETTTKAKAAVTRWRQRLWDEGDAPFVSRLFARLAQRITDEKAAKLIQREADYFEANAHRCRYPTFRALGYPVSSGAVEGACGTFGQRRCKQPGMSWDLDGVSGCLALRAYRENDRWLELFPDAAQPRAA